ncbi:hypothetical protein BV898_19354 [Hypsibius exemplaris]|uniref:Uncharacterized protein n=1 Tax=Hypsibius exemplaris TaxID=2072580 RepID=A0A9X6RPD6_HYPEX|nr:hypothetical protein BV898_19354 [Hypsibius exemplaris]
MLRYGVARLYLYRRSYTRAVLGGIPFCAPVAMSVLAFRRFLLAAGTLLLVFGLYPGSEATRLRDLRAWYLRVALLIDDARLSKLFTVVLVLPLRLFLSFVTSVNPSAGVVVGRARGFWCSLRDVSEIPRIFLSRGSVGFDLPCTECVAGLEVPGGGIVLRVCGVASFALHGSVLVVAILWSLVARQLRPNSSLVQIARSLAVLSLIGASHLCLVYRVQRAIDLLAQTVCTMRSSRDGESFDCRTSFPGQ